MMRFLPVILLVTSCAPAISGSQYWDGRFWWTSVKTASDIAGGPRQDIVVVTDRDGRIVNQFQASGPGTLQALVGSLAPAIMTGAGQAMAGYLTRPARNTTDVRMDVQGTGGSGGGGGSNVTTATSTGGASTTSSSSAGSNATATGGNAVVPP